MDFVYSVIRVCLAVIFVVIISVCLSVADMRYRFGNNFSRFVVIRKSFTGFIVFCFARIEFTRRIQRVVCKGFCYVSFIVVNGFLNGFTFRNFFPFDIGFLTNDISRIIVIVFRMTYKRLSFTVCYQSVLLYNKRSQKLSNDLLLLSD